MLPLQREDVTRPIEVFRGRFWIGQLAKGVGSIKGADSGRDPLTGIDRDGKGTLLRITRFRVHRGQLKSLDDLWPQRSANQTPCMCREKVDLLWGDRLGGQHQIPLVLTIGIVDEDDHPTTGNLLDQLFHGCKGQSRLQPMKGNSLKRVRL